MNLSPTSELRIIFVRACLSSPSVVNNQLMTIACWSHSASSFVHSMMTTGCDATRHAVHWYQPRLVYSCCFKALYITGAIIFKVLYAFCKTKFAALPDKNFVTVDYRMVSTFCNWHCRPRWRIWSWCRGNWTDCLLVLQFLKRFNPVLEFICDNS